MQSCGPFSASPPRAPPRASYTAIVFEFAVKHFCAVIPHKKKNNKPHCGNHKFQWDLQDVPHGIKPVVGTFLLAHKALYKKLALHKV